MKFRSPDDIDRKIKKLSDKELIKELNKKQLTSDDFKMLGDLYLKKGDKRKAIDYLYKAAEKLVFDRSNKAIAVYKQIMNISPNEVKAFEGIIDIFSKEGLIGEQIKYLLLLAKLYQNKGDVTKTTSIYRRVQEIDPKNKAAEIFFNRGKAT